LTSKNNLIINIFLMKAYLSLSGIGLFSGRYFGWAGACTGEIFHFKSTLFKPEILTDPAYHKGIIIVDTGVVEDRWPMPEHNQSFMAHLSGLVMLGNIESSENPDIQFTLRNFLSANRITGFVPDNPEMLRDALIFAKRMTGSIDKDRQHAESNAIKPVIYSEPDLKAISSPQEYLWDLASGEMPEEEFNLVIWDFGINYGLLRNLKKLGCRLLVAPPDTSPERIISLHPDGIVIAGGPPGLENMPELAERVGRMVGIRPTLGVGNGALLLALAIGISLRTLDMPHFGGDIAVEDFRGNITTTYQSHSLAVSRRSMEKSGAEITYLNARDGSIEGYAYRDFPAFGSMFSMTDEAEPAFLSDFISSLDKSLHMA
jgi:carbamoyl-phosphate synthase small subunit